LTGETLCEGIFWQAWHTAMEM